VKSGALGKIRVIQAEYPQDWLSTPTDPGNKQASWRTDPKRSGAGGAIGDIGTHAYNLLRFVTGLKTEAVSADLQSFVKGRKVDDNVHILLRMQGGARGMLWASQVAPGNENGLQLRVYGEKAGLEHLKVVPTTDLNITLGMSLTVFLLVMFYSFKIKGFRGFGWELLTHPFGKWMMPFNLLLNLIEHLARPVSLALRLFGNLYAGEVIFLLLAVLGGSFAINSFAGVGGAVGQLLFGTVWAVFHILVIPLQAFIFTVLTIVYLAQAHETHH